MKIIESHKSFTQEEYFLFEEKSELRHELINGNLYEMSGISIFHNNIVSKLHVLLYMLLKGTNWQITLENFKVKTPDKNFFYPGISICYPEVEKYFSEKPVLIIEVLSDTTRKYNLIDKFIQYQKIETLSYYLCVEPEQQVIFFYFKRDDGEWMTDTLTKDEQVISLPKLSISFSIRDIYKS